MRKKLQEENRAKNKEEKENENKANYEVKERETIRRI